MKEYKWCAIDAEGDVGNLGLLGVAFYSENNTCYLTDHSEITRLLTEYAQAGYTFLAHNAEYDLTVIFWQLDIPMHSVYFNNRFNRGEWRHTSGKTMCQLWDTFSLSGGISLARLGKAIGYPKYKTPQRLLGIDPDRYQWTCDAHHRGECEECYAIRDVEIVYRFMVGLQHTLSAWGVASHRRISGLADKVWRALDTPSSIALTDSRIKRLGRAAYHGGRTETFKLGHLAPLYIADVSSMYPSVMIETPFPDPAKMIYNEEVASLDGIINYEGVATVDITIPPMYVPPLPCIMDGELCYPVGRFKGSYTLLELRYALSLGATINNVYALAFSMESIYPFNRFINTLWLMRQEYAQTKDPRQIFAKLLMNNLYGRLGMRENLTRTDVYPCDPNKTLRSQPKTQWYTQDHRLYLTFERPQPKRDTWTNVVWAAQITAAARIKLHRAALLQGESLIYCDTDSVFSTRPINGIGEGLGALRPDGEFQACTIAAPKLYAVQDFNGEWTAKARGVPRAFALEFLRTGSATYKEPIRPLSQSKRRIAAGTWVEVTTESQHLPARRQPLQPDQLADDYGWSDTAPRVSLPL